MYNRLISRAGVVMLSVMLWIGTYPPTVNAISPDTTTEDSMPLLLQEESDPIISISDVSVREKSGSVNVLVYLDKAVGHEVMVRYSTVDGSAKSPGDYTSDSGILKLPAGATSTSISLIIVDDEIPEQTETFTVHLSDPEASTLRDGNEMAMVTVVDADPSSHLGYLFAVYMVTWAGFFAYVIILSGRHKAIRNDIQRLREHIDRERGSKQ